MKTIREIAENNNLIPYKTVFLLNGIVCKHYRNGSIKTPYDNSIVNKPINR